MVSARRGRSTMGCLFILLLLTAAGYFAVNVGEPYFRFYQFQDAMEQEVRFARNRPDAAIKRPKVEAMEKGTFAALIFTPPVTMRTHPALSRRRCSRA